jgi:predicted small lipoprotein YifL
MKTRHAWIMAAAAAFTLSACGGPSEAPGGDAGTDAVQAAAAGLPNLFQVSYRLEAQIHDEAGGMQPLTLIRDGRSTRIEMSQPGQGEMAIVFAEGEAFMLVNQLGQRMAMRMNPTDAPALPEEEWEDPDPSVRRVGDCSVIGERGVEWESADTGTGSPGRACITPDGVMLRASEGDRVIWEATSIDRGPQDPALFTIPADYQVLDLSDPAAIARQLGGQ